MSLEYADCKECGGEGELFSCLDVYFPEREPGSYVIRCKDCHNEGPIRPSQEEASREWAMLGKRRNPMTMSDAIEQGYLAFQQWVCGAMEDKGRELNKLAKVVCPHNHEKWVHWDSRRDTYCYECGGGTHMTYSGEMRLE